MENEDLSKIIKENPNDYDLGLKIRTMEIEGDLPKDDFEDKYLRLSAEFDNFKKRTLKDKADSIISAKISMLDSILDIDNDLSIAAAHSTDPGIALIISKLGKFLQSQNIETIQTDVYDADIHEVVGFAEAEVKNKIVSVVSKGYTFGEKIIRYPKIVLSKNS